MTYRLRLAMLIVGLSLCGAYAVHASSPLPSVPAVALVKTAGHIPLAYISSRALRVSNHIVAGATADTVVVDPLSAGRVLPADFFGINYTAFWDDAQGSKGSASALTQTPVRSVRFPGGVVADWYDWQQPYYRGWSRTSPLDLWHYARSFGATSVLFGTNYQGHLPAPPGKTYAVNSPANAAAWVSSNRAARIPAVMEVGNEEDLKTMHTVDDPAYGAYIAAFSAQARAMHAADPGVRVLGPAGTNEYYWWALDGLGMFLRRAGNRTGTGQVDGISLHFYKSSTWYDARNVAQYWLSPDGPWAAIQSAIRAHDTRRLPVYLTEWNLGSSDRNNPFTPTLGHALAVADLLGAFALSGVAGEYYYGMHGADGWGLFYGKGERRPLDTPTPSYYAMALWKHMGSHLVPVAQSVDPGSIMSVYAATGRDRSVQVLAINKQHGAQVLHVVLNGATAAGRLRVYSLTPASGGVTDLDTRYNGVLMPSAQRALPAPRDAGPVRGSSLSYTVPGYSIVLLELTRTSPARRLKGATAPGSNTVAQAPPLAVSVAGAVARVVLKGGEHQLLSATIRCNDDLGVALLDFEVYNGSQRVYQATKLVTVTAGSRLTVHQPYTPPQGTFGGTYYLKLGLYGPNWRPSFAWNSTAATFIVAGAVQPIVSLTVQAPAQQVHAGSTVSLRAAITSRGNSLSHALVDIEVYGGNGARVCQAVVRDVDVKADSTTRVSTHCVLPAALPASTYVVKAGVFGSSWAPRYIWSDDAALLLIQSAATRH